MRSELDFRGVSVGKLNGRLVAGPVFCPVYVLDGQQDSKNPDKLLIDDVAFTARTDNEAAKIAIMRRVDTALCDLVWLKKVVKITLAGIANRPGRVGLFDVLFYAGPTFDLGRRADDRATKQAAARGLPTGLPGDRKIIVTDPAEIAATAERFYEQKKAR